ncbi:MAG: GNAT family N-acetyltransferase [Legionella sp.]|jgi:predicted N-acetyltransferase YhbS
MIKIELLSKHQNKIPELAEIWREGLGKHWLPDVAIERVQQKFQEHLNEDKLPLTFVAFYEEKPVGMCSLRVNDGIRPDLMPWLGSLVVDPEYQKKGIAKKLIDAIKVKAIQLGFEELYLFAFDSALPQYYQKLGWEIIGMDKFQHHPVTVMKIYL